jgi:hypothetical protein
VKINGEAVTLVTSFGQLREGLIVWATGCLRCNGGKHRFILMRKDHGEVEGATGIVRTTDFYDAEPAARCGVDAIGVKEVAERIVYRVVGQLPLAKRQCTKELAR